MKSDQPKYQPQRRGEVRFVYDPLTKPALTIILLTAFSILAIAVALLVIP